jgi:predicted RNase H-like nuclease (RuvC/YqgF family)
MRDALRRGRLAAERAAIAAVIPPDPSAELRTVEKDLRRIHRQREDLAAGKGRYADGPIGRAIWELRQAEMNVARLKRDLDRSGASRKDRRRSRSELGDWQERHGTVTRGLAAVVAPEASRLDAEEEQLTGRLSELRKQQANRRDWVADHSEASRRLNHLASEIETLDERLQRTRRVPARGVGLGQPGSWTPPPVARERELGMDLGL